MIIFDSLNTIEILIWFIIYDLAFLTGFLKGMFVIYSVTSECLRTEFGLRSLTAQ